MRTLTIIIVLCISTHTFAQKTSDCGTPSDNTENLQKKWNETILELKPVVSAISTSNKKFEIRNDTLQTATKIRVKGKTAYNITKFPLKKLVAITTSFNELVIYTKRKEIVDERYGYKKLKTSQITILKQLKKGEHQNLIDLFKKIKALNYFRNKR